MMSLWLSKGFYSGNGGDSRKKAERSFFSLFFRIYGKDAQSFYDPVYELKVFKTLSRYRIAPQLIACVGGTDFPFVGYRCGGGQGSGWRIEEWHASIAVPTKLLGNPSILCQVGKGDFFTEVQETSCSDCIPTWPFSQAGPATGFPEVFQYGAGNNEAFEVGRRCFAPL